MTWHYQATHQAVQGIDVYEVREVYDDDGKLSWTEDAIAPSSETGWGLIEVLEMMLADVRKHDVLDVDGV